MEPRHVHRDGGPALRHVITTDPGTDCDGVIRCSPGAADIGEDTVYVAVSDSFGQGNGAFVSVHVFPNDRPAILPVPLGCLLGRDGWSALLPDGRPLTFPPPDFPLTPHWPTTAMEQQRSIWHRLARTPPHFSHHRDERNGFIHDLGCC